MKKAILMALVILGVCSVISSTALASAIGGIEPKIRLMSAVGGIEPK